VFPETHQSPPLVPEEIDEEAPVPAAEITACDVTAVVERVTIAEHYMVVENVEACLSVRHTKPGAVIT
jgi:hypothetical protein